MSKSIDDLVKELPEHSPKRDLWQGIEAAIVKDEQSVLPLNSNKSQWLKYSSLAASICLVAVLAYSVPQLGNEYRGQVAGDILKELEIQHNKQKQALLVSYEDVPAAIEDWQSQLTELEQAADAIKKALAEDPDNTALLKMLQNVYQQQFDLIEIVHVSRWQRI